MSTSKSVIIPTQTLLAFRRHELATRKDPLDFPGTWTARECDAYEEATDVIRRRVLHIEQTIDAFRVAGHVVAQLAAEHLALTQWQNDLPRWRALLAAELVTVPTYEPNRGDRVLREDLLYSLEAIDHGVRKISGAVVYTLRSTRLGELIAADYGIDTTTEARRLYGGVLWRGSLAEVATSLADVAQRLETARDDLARAREYVDALG